MIQSEAHEEKAKGSLNELTAVALSCKNFKGTAF